ncbi:MAG: hypothetical protein L6Q37_01470, partial [Bdellovibrionaceae bacterium]|nr:hypothetical protein [Pseudobdellovibrionaceae bacterium]
AYTKDSLLKAYSWLQNQEASIKEMATTPDILVSLYLKATRDGDAVLDRPSIQNFKHELKQLAGMMGEFDKEFLEERIQKEKQSKEKQITVEKNVEAEVDKQEELTTAFSQISEHFSQNYNSPVGSQKSNEISKVSSSAVTSLSPSQEIQKTKDFSLLTGLDAKSLLMINEVKQQLNLSSDLESLKLLIQAGYNKTKKLF